MSVHALTNSQLFAFTGVVLVAGYLIVVVSNVLAFRAGVAVGERRRTANDDEAARDGRRRERSAS